MLRKIKNLTKEIGTLSIGIAIAFVVFMGLSIANGWTEPTVAPPGGNVGAPINTSSIGQAKFGGLILNIGGAANGLIVQNGKVGIGTDNPKGLLSLHSSDSQPQTLSGTGLLGVYFTDGDTGTNYDSDGAYVGTGTGNKLYIANRENADLGLWTNNLEKVTIKNSGNVGIGDLTPDGDLKLDVEGKVGATEYCDQNGQNCMAAGSAGAHYGYCSGNWGNKSQIGVAIEPAFWNSSPVTLNCPSGGCHVGCSCRAGYKKVLTGTCNFGDCLINPGGSEIYFYTCLKN